MSSYFKRLVVLNLVGVVAIELVACTFNFTPNTPVTPGTQIPNSSPTVVPSLTMEPTNTLAPTTILTPTETVEPSPSPEPPTPTPASFAPRVVVENPVYLLQPGSPVALPSFTTGCGWMGVAGQVFGTKTETVPLLVVQVGGKLQGEEFLGLTLTGTALQYGPGGYELALADHAIDSDNSMWIQIFDLEGDPLSQQVYFNTYSDCERNLTLINFTSTALSPVFDEFFYFPLVLRDGTLQ